MIFCCCNHIPQQGLAGRHTGLTRKSWVTSVTAVPLADFCVVHAIEIIQLLFLLTDGAAIGLAADGGVHPGFMRNDDFSVAGNSQVHLKCGNAGVQRSDEGGDGIFRHDTACTTMPLDIEDRIGILADR